MGVSPTEKNRINKDRYSTYVQNLRDTGQRFPENRFGEVNLSKVAETCGFKRGVFAENKAFRKQLENDVNEIGTETRQATPTDEYLAQKNSDNDKVIGQLRKENALLNDQINALQVQVMNAQYEITKLKNAQDEQDASLDEMLKTGRRFTL